MSKKFRIAIFKLIDILVILTMVSASPMSMTATVLAQEAGPALAADKADYAVSETARITGSGFSPGGYLLAVSGPDGIQDWGTVTADDTGAFLSDSPALASTGSYEVRAYPSEWSGEWTEAPVASTNFTVTAPPPPTDAPTEPPTATEPPTVPPTDTPTSEPTATQAPTDTPTTEPTVVPTSTPEPPTITSDKDDYQPGELVTLTGTGWTGDTTVTITVVDSAPTVYRDTDQVQVRADGTITDSFYLPTTFVDVYFVTAKGAQTGRVATTMFTDAPGLTLTKSASPLTYTAAGQTITYSYALSNTGTTNLNPPFNVTDNKVSTITCPNINTVGNGNGVLEPGETITCTGSYTITASNVSFGFVANTASASSSGAGATTSNPDTRIVSLPVTCRNDTAGANDVPGQKDLTQECEAPSSVNPLVISWNWDEISQPGGNSADGCALFDTDNDGLANYALCVSWQGQRVMQAGYPQLYSCTDTRSDRCTGSVPQTIQNGTGCALELASDDPFSAGANFPQDTKAFCSINLADVGGAQISSLIDVCSYPSAIPNSAPSDCVVITTSRGNLEVIKSVVPNDTSTNWNISWTGPTPFSTTITGSGDTGIQPVTAGSYNISEAAGSGTDLSQYDTTWACTVNGSPSSSGSGTTITGVSVANGNVVICTFTNTKGGHIIVDKVTSPSGDPTSFSFDANGGTSPAYTDFSLTDAAAPNDQLLKAGNYSVSETTPSGWTLTSATCTSSIGDTETPGSIELDAGETVTCTFNNTKQAPSLTLVKTATPSTYSAVGQTINYSYLVTNAGNVSLAGPVTVTDDKATVTCPNVNTVGNNNGFLDPGESITCTASYTITQTDLNNGSVTNTATASAGGINSNQDSETVTATQSPALTLVKTATPNTYDSVGDVISYSYLVTNSGNVRLAGPVTVNDDRATVSCPSVNTVGNNDSFLDPGESLTCTASYTITQADLNAGSVTNTATASAGGTNSNQDSETVTAVQAPALTLVKTATPSTYDSVGDVISYSFAVTNSGNVRISGPVTITDDKATDEACPNVNTVGNNDSFLDPGESITCTASYTVTQSDLNAGSVTNIAQAHASGTDSNTDTETVTAVQAPALTLVKTATPGTYDSVGDVISYSYLVTNSGNVRLAGPVTITDDKSTDEACPSVNTVGNNDGFLDPGESITCTASYTITQSDLNAGSVTNTAQAHASGTDSNTDTETVTAVQSPALTLVKTATPATYSAVGNVISYSFAVTNSGNVSLAGPVTVTDDKSTDEACPNVNTVGNNDGLLDPGESITCSSTHTISQADLNAGSVTNVAQAHAGGTDSNTDTETVTATQSPALTLAKTATPTTYSAVGDVISYSFLLTNSGNVTLVAPFTITDDKATDEACPASPTSLAPGDSITCTASYTITQADLDAGSVTNTATGHGFFGATPVNSNQDSETVTATQTPELTVVKTATPGTYDAVGDTISYSYQLTNTGNVTLSGPFTVTDDKATVTCPATASLAPTASITCSATYTITQADLNAGSVTNTAQGHAVFDGDPVDSNQDSETVTATQTPALSLVKTASPATYDSIGDIISYSYLLTNSGNVTLSGPFTVTDDKATVSCPATASLAPNASITCSATYVITQADLDAGSVTNTAKGHAFFGTTPVDSNEDSETVTADQTPELTLDKTAAPVTYDSLGDTIAYSYELTNTGNVTLTGPFTVTDDKATVTCPATASLAPNASITCSATYTITQADLDAGFVTNIATGHATFDGDPVDSNQDTETVTADQSAALSLDKTASPGTYDSVGDTISYSYLLTNMGNVTLAGPFTVTDDKATVTCPATTSLAPNASITCSATYTITQADLDAGFVTNTATGHATFDGDPVDSNQDSETVTATQTPELTLDKTATPVTYDSVGDTISYSYLLTNTGNVTLAGPFTVTDDKATVTCPATPSLAPTASITCSASYIITQADLDSGSVTNMATGHATFDGDPVDSNQDSETVTATQTPELTLDKTASPVTYDEVGDTISYSYLLTNTGNVTLSGPLTISDDNATVTCPTTASLAPTASITCSATYTITQADLDAGFVTNTAQGKGSFNDNDVLSNEDSETVTAVQTPSLIVDKALTDNADEDGSGTVSLGDTLTYTITATNNGNVTLHNVVVSDSLTGNSTNCPSVAPGNTCVLTVTYVVTQADVDAGNIHNVGTADSDDTPPTEDPNDVPVPQNPEIDLVKSVTSTGPYDSVGDVITYELIATNTGNVTLSNVTISDPLLGTLVCTPVQPATLAPNAVLTCTGSYMIAQADLDAGQVNNTATAKGTFDGTDYTDTDSQTVPLTQSAALTLDKTASPATYDSVGDTISYSYLLTNSGNVTLSGPFTVTDDKATVTCPATASLAPTASITCSATYTITQADLDAGSVTNVAQGHATFDGDPVDSNTDTETVTATQSPALTLEKTASPATYDSVGNVIGYSYLLTNSGNVTLSGPFTVTDDKATVTCPATISLAPGASITCTANYIISQADLDAGSVTNTATGHAFFGTTPVNSNEDSATVTATQSPQLSLEKSADPVTYDSVGDTISYSYLLTNTGNVTLSGPFTVADNKATVTCPATASLAPTASITCSATYVITQADLDAGSVTNTATGKGSFNGNDVFSNEDTATVTATQSPALSLDKTANPTTYDSIGDLISYSYLLTNSGNVTLSGPFTVTDNKATVICPVTVSLAPGASITCTATYIITQADLDAGFVTNTAQGHASFNGNAVDSNEDSETVDATQSPALSLDKTASPATYDSVGDTISYSYLLTNTGNVTLFGPFSVADNKATVTCPVTVSLAPGASITCSATYTISQADLDAGSVTNTAQGKGSFNGNDVFSNEDSETVTAVQSPALTLVKSATPATYDSVGDTISYSYLLTNSGNVTLSGPFTVTDDKATVTCPATISLAPGASITCTANYIISQADLDAGSVTNVAQGHATFDGDPVDSNTDTETVTATQSPALTLDKTASPATYDSVGDTVNYSYLLTNSGNVTLSGPFTVTDNKATVSCPATASLAPGASITCSATYTITQADLDAGSVTNTAQGKGSFNGNDVFSNQDSATVDAVQSPALSLEKTADPLTYDSVGDTISYSYLLTNTGNVTLSGPFTVTDNKATVTCPVTATLAPTASITCSATYIITQADLDSGSVTNTATGHATFDGNPVDSNEDSATVTAVQSPAIDLVKSVTTTGPYDSLSDVITYELIATNTGNVTLSNVTISDPLLGTLVCTPVQPATLAPNATLTCTGSYAITQADLDAGQVSNTATAKGTFNGNDYTDTDSATVPLTQSPSLIVDKVLTDNADEDGSGTVSVNDTLTYTITATNNGNVTLHNVTVSDSLTGDSTVCASVAPTSTCVLTVTYVVTQADVDAGNIHNVGAADSNETSPTEDPNDVPVPQNPAVSLDKSGTFDAGANGYADPGEVITYTFIVTNTGNVTLHNVSISDPNVPTITCPSGNPIPVLAVGASETCTGTYAVTQDDVDAGSVYNLATATSDESEPDTGDETVTFPPRLIIIKQVINNNGGAKVATEFSFQVNGGSSTPFQQDGSDPLKGTNTVTVNPGSYSVTEPAVNGYTTSYSTDCSGTIANGETKTCTITNDDISPTLTVIKALLPGTDTGLFNLQIDGTTQAADVGDNGTTGPIAVNAGVVHTVGETAGTGTNLSDYVTTIGGDCAADGTISLALAENKTCTITNVRRGSIIIVKNSLGGDGTFEFTSSTLGNFGLTTSGGTASTTFSGLDPANTYDVAETVPAGWELNSATCDSGETINSIDLEPGETVTCSFENEKAGNIVIVKNTVGGDGTFDFTSTTLGNFSLTTASNTASTTFSNLDVDLTYDVAETVPAGWDLTGATCDSGETINSIDLEPGETVTCTFTNTRRGHIIVDKVTLPSGDTQSFAFVTTGSGYTGFNLTDAATPNDQALPPGTYSVTETVPAGWDLTGLSCTDPSGAPVIAGNKASINLAAGETVNCTFTNTKRGKITIVKDAVPNDPQDFAFTSTIPGAASFTLDDDPASSSPTSNKTVTNLLPGAYSVTEGAVAGWDLTGLTCNDANGTTSPGTRTANIALDPGEEVTCTFTNTKRGTIIVEKQTIPNAAPGLFTFTGDAAGTIADNGTITVANLVPGTYTSTEADPSGILFKLTSISCNDASSATPSTGNVTTRTATFNLDPGETVRCVFTNTKDFHAGTIGFWKNWRNHYTSSQIQVLINYLKLNNPKVYNKDLINSTSDDLTITKLDAIFNVGSSTPRDQMILAQLTAVKLNLAITQLQNSSGLVQKNDNICLAGTIDVSGIPGAISFFGSSTPTIQQVVTAVENRWTGNLTTSRSNWKFNFSNNTQRDMIIKVLTGINEGTIVMNPGCP